MCNQPAEPKSIWSTASAQYPGPLLRNVIRSNATWNVKPLGNVIDLLIYPITGYQKRQQHTENGHFHSHFLSTLRSLMKSGIRHYNNVWHSTSVVKVTCLDVEACYCECIRNMFSMFVTITLYSCRVPFASGTRFTGNTIRALLRFKWRTCAHTNTITPRHQNSMQRLNLGVKRYLQREQVPNVPVVHLRTPSHAHPPVHIFT